MLYSPKSNTAVVITPEEAEILIPDMRRQIIPQTHLVTYSPPTTRDMEDFNSLSYYTVPGLPVLPPQWLIIELGIYSGRLYFGFRELPALKAYFELCLETTTGFTQSPYSFMIEWLAIRRNGQDILHTPMGYLCQGRSLHAKHPFFVSRRRANEDSSDDADAWLDAQIKNDASDDVSSGDDSDWSHIDDGGEGGEEDVVV